MRNNIIQKIKKAQSAERTVRSLPKKNQHGVTLVELTIVLIIIGIIIAVLYTQIGGTNTRDIRAANGFRHAKLVANAARLQKETLGCYPIQVMALINKSTYEATTGNSCGTTEAVSGSQFPFIRGVDVVQGQDNQINLDDISEGARGSMQEVTGTDPDYVYYRISATDAVATAMYNQCASTTGTPSNTALVSVTVNPCIYGSVADGNDNFGYVVGRD